MNTNSIKSIRELKNYTQEYMAEAMGITQAGYSKIEKGKTGLSLTKLEKIAQILNVSIESILTFDTKRYIDSFKVKGNQFNPTSSQTNSINTVEKLYQDKIVLLELLLKKTDSELIRYKEKFGAF